MISRTVGRCKGSAEGKVKHQVEALEDSAFLLTVSWPDNEKLQAMKHRGYGT